MVTDTALYVCNDSVRQASLDSHLQSIGIEMHKASSIPIAKQRLYEHKYNLLLIHFESVRTDIFDLCTFTRLENYDTVIVILMSKVQPAIESRLFDCGADDIAAGKQISPNALMSRLKRRLINISTVPQTNKTMLKGGAIVDLERREIRLNGSFHKLKRVPLKLLQHFLENPHRVISRDELLQSHIWDNSVCSHGKIEQGKAIDMAITRLRRLIEPDPSKPQIITSVHGTGWILEKDAVL